LSAKITKKEKFTNFVYEFTEKKKEKRYKMQNNVESAR